MSGGGPSGFRTPNIASSQGDGRSAFGTLALDILRLVRRPQYPGQPRSRPEVGVGQAYPLILARVLARPSQRRRSLATLLEASDLPGSGWSQLHEGSWRMGMSRRFGPISRRARMSGSCAALRRYRQETPPRGVFIQAGPYASAEDAEVVASQARSAGGITWTGVARLEESQVDDVAVPTVDDSLVWEHRTARGDYVGFQRFISGRVVNVVFVVAGTAKEPGMAWEDLVAIAAAQATKIRNQLASEQHRGRPSP